MADQTPSNEPRLRAVLAQVSRLLYERGLVAGLDGNLSVRLSPDRFLATPTAAHLGLATEDTFLLVDRAGDRVSQGSGRVTSEWPLHSAIYAARPDVGAVVHAHPVHVIAGSLREVPPPLDRIPEALIALGPVATLPYLTTGSPDLAHAVAEAIPDHDALVLAQHGAVTVGPDLIAAFARMESLEHTCHVCALVPGGVPDLPPDERRRLDAIRHRLAAAR